MDDAIKRVMVGVMALCITIGATGVIVAWAQADAAKVPLEKILREANS